MGRRAKTEMALVCGEVHEDLSPTATAPLPLNFLSKLSAIMVITIVLWAVMLDNAHAQTDGFTSDPDEIELLYQEGKHKEALDAWMIKAFEGEAEAQFKVGTMFREGQGITPDPKQSVYWYLQAARQDHIAAQYNLGHAFMSGSGVEKDEPEAVRWWTSAAKAGDELAQFNVGRAYYMGIGATKDENQAKRWFVAAAEQGESRSQALVNRLGWNTEAGPATTDSNTATTEPTRTVAETPPIPQPTTPSLATEPEPTPPLVAGPAPATAVEPTPLPETANVQLDDETTVPLHLANKAIGGLTASKENVTSPSLPTTRARLPLTSQATNTMAVATSNSSARSSNRLIDTFSIDRAMVIYQDSDTHSNTLGILPTSERVDVIEKSGPWLKIRRRTGIPMWVSSRYLRTTTSDSGRITGDSVNVRATPTINDTNKLGHLQNGETVRVQCSGRDWSFITSPSDFTGWVLAHHSGAPAPIAASVCPAPPSNQSLPNRPATQVAALSGPAAPAPTKFAATQDDTWLFAQQPGNFTIQLAKFQTPAGLTQYLVQNRLSGDSLLKQFTHTSIRHAQAYLLYGSYRTQIEALQKARELGTVNPWVRNISVVRANRCRRWNIQKIRDTPASRYCA
jgi:TPR repeat protein